MVARAGMINSLAQLVLKIGSPGVPDFYQGTELWDLHLVDPDNRGLVDYAARVDALNALEPLLAAVQAGAGDRRASVRELLRAWPDGRIKLFVTAAGLRARRHHSEVLLRGAYLPIASEPHGSASVVAFGRELDDTRLLVAVSRLTAELPTAEDALPIGDAWAGHRLPLPSGWRHTAMTDVLTGSTMLPRADADGPDGSLDTADVFGALPVALLIADDVR
jgi:(1->4)-alpha-D-glucan 1-alpha-D-glucosylmutase